MAKGGARLGAGRKAKQIQAFTPTVHTGGKEGVTHGVSAIPPEDLPVEQRAFWHRYAPAAIQKGTLTPQTETAFRLLCETESEKNATRQTIDGDGRTFLKITVDGAGVEHQELKAHPLTSSYHRLIKATEALMARFGMAPFGKPEQAVGKATKANPWASIAK